MLHWKAFGGLLRGEASVRFRESRVAAAMAASGGGCIVNLPGPATFVPSHEHSWTWPAPSPTLPQSRSSVGGLLSARHGLGRFRCGTPSPTTSLELQADCGPSGWTREPQGSPWVSTRSYRCRDGLTPLPAKASRRDREKQQLSPTKPSLGKGQFKDKDAVDLIESIDSDWLYMFDEDEALRDAPFLDAVVKVYCTHTEPNFSLPWQKQRQYSSTGSGFMIANRRLLTNAHCVEHHTQVKVKRRGDDTKFVATVLAIGPECDIALLSVDDDEFWKDVEPLRFGSLPHLQDDVTVVGYPVGGDTISVTSGVVSRIEVTSYVHGAAELLAVQIDAAINPGNSGGPAFNKKGECVGIAFQTLKSADTENIGWVIPTPVVAHFLSDFERNGKFTGFPCLGILWQRLENPAMREFLKMKEQKGVLIRKVEPTSPSSNVIKQGDVLLKFDGVSIANEGTVPFRGLERISFGFLVSQKFSGETAELELLRDGEVLKLQTTLKTAVHLVPVHIGGRLPSYYIVAGLVFTPVCQPFLESEYGGDYEFTAVRLLEKAGHSMAQFDDEQLVVVAQVLANDVNIGYEEIANTQVLAFNGTKIRNLKQLAELVDACTDDFLRLELDYDTLIVLETTAARKSISQVLLDHGIPSERSPDLSLRDASVQADPDLVANAGVAPEISPDLSLLDSVPADPLVVEIDRTGAECNQS